MHMHVYSSVIGCVPFSTPYHRYIHRCLQCYELVYRETYLHSDEMGNLVRFGGNRYVIACNKYGKEGKIGIFLEFF